MSGFSINVWYGKGDDEERHSLKPVFRKYCTDVRIFKWHHLQIIFKKER